MAKSKKLNPIVAEDLYSFCFPSNLSFNPSGTTLVFTLARCDEASNGYLQDVYCLENGNLKQLTSTLNARNVTWLNEEEALLQRKDDKSIRGTDFFKINVHGGEAIPFLNVPFACASLKVVDENTFVALGLFDTKDPDAYLDDEETYQKKAEQLEAEKDYQVVDEIPYWRNGQGFTNNKRHGLFLVQKGKVKRLTGVYEDVSEFDLDGNKIYYFAKKFEHKYELPSQVYVYNISTKKKETIYGKKDYVFHNLFVKDHELFAQASDMKLHGAHQTGAISKITKNKIEQVDWSDRSFGDTAATDTLYGSGKQNEVSGKNWYTLACEDDHIEIWKLNSKFEKTVLFNKDGLISCLSVGNNKICFVYEDENHLGDLYEIKTDGTGFKKLTHFNEEWMKNKYIAKPHRVDYTSTDCDLHGWVLLPENYNAKKKYPAILDIHGGPRGIYATSFMHEMQIWTSAGFIVFFTNIRGSDGRGDDFADINGHFGEWDYQNLMDFTDKVLENYPSIDQKRVCVTGGSYGGFMCNWIVGHTNRFCACATQRSISDYFSKVFISDNGVWYNLEQHNAKDVWNHFDNLWKYSPLKYVQGAKTPTLFIHSDQDYRCPLPEGMQMMQALAVQGVETRMVIFHGENHELSRGGKPAHRIKRLTEITNWFIGHTK